MSARYGVGMVVVAALVGAACNGISERPGHDFSIRLLNSSPILALGQIFVPVPFAVVGCETFDLAFEDGAGALHALPYTSQAAGTFQASVPVSWMRDAASGLSTWCTGEAFYPPPPIDGALIATCRDVVRSARAPFTASIATAPATLWLRSIGRAIFPSDDPLTPWFAAAYAQSGFFGLAPRYPPDSPYLPDWEAATVNPLARPRLARSGDRLFVTLGCEPGAACPQQNERLAEVSLADARDAPLRGIAHVPAAVIDIAHAPDGALVVLSQTGDIGQYSSGNTSTIVTRVEPAPDGSQGPVENAVTLVAELPRHAPLGKFAKTASGALRFLTRAYPETPGPLEAVLHSTDGHTVDDVMTAAVVGDYRADGPHFFDHAILSPDGSRMLVTDSYGLQLVSADPAHPARDRLDYSGTMDGAGWLPGAVAVWYASIGSRSGTVQVFDDTAPNAFRWEYVVHPLPGAVRPPLLVDVTAVGDKLVLTTATGLRILGPDGTLLGGSDPFPCGLSTTAVAVQTGPTTVGVGAVDLLYVFDVGP